MGRSRLLVAYYAIDTFIRYVIEKHEIIKFCNELTTIIERII